MDNKMLIRGKVDEIFDFVYSEFFRHRN